MDKNIKLKDIKSVRDVRAIVVTDDYVIRYKKKLTTFLLILIFN